MRRQNSEGGPIVSTDDSIDWRTTLYNAALAAAILTENSRGEKLGGADGDMTIRFVVQEQRPGKTVELEIFAAGREENLTFRQCRRKCGKRGEEEKMRENASCEGELERRVNGYPNSWKTRGT